MSSEQTATPRMRLKALLAEGFKSARELSGELSLPEREVIHHLEKLRQFPGRGERLLIEPAVCLGCGFSFQARERATRPSRCPGCRGTHLSGPRYSFKASS